MAPDYGNQYRIRIVREDGIEELSEWMNSTEQVAQIMHAIHQPQHKQYWLLVRNILSTPSPDGEQIMEYPIIPSPSPRYRTRDTLQFNPARFGYQGK